MLKEDSAIVLIKNYGKINLKLKDIMISKNITRNSLSRAIHTRFEVVDKWYKNDIEKIDADILARLCYVLKCQVCDIIEYSE